MRGGRGCCGQLLGLPPLNSSPLDRLQERLGWAWLGILHFAGERAHVFVAACCLRFSSLSSNSSTCRRGLSLAQTKAKIPKGSFHARQRGWGPADPCLRRGQLSCWLLVFGRCPWRRFTWLGIVLATLVWFPKGGPRPFPDPATLLGTPRVSDVGVAS